jgi:hypothetical protein
MHPCNIIPTRFLFLSSYLLSFPSPLFAPWSPKAKRKKDNNFHEAFLILD